MPVIRIAQGKYALCIAFEAFDPDIEQEDGLAWVF